MGNLGREKSSRRSMVCLMIFAVMLLAAGGAWAQQCGMREGKACMGGAGLGCGGDCIMRLESLTDEQRDELIDIQTKAKKECISLCAELASLQVDLRSLMRADKPKASKVESLARSIGETQGRICASQLLHRIEMKNVLTAEQREELKGLCRGECSSWGGGCCSGGGMGMCGPMGRGGCCGNRMGACNGMGARGACDIRVERFKGGSDAPETMRGGCRGGGGS